MHKEGIPRGQTLVIVTVILLFLFALALAVSGTNSTVFRGANRIAKSRVANAAATAGVEKALWCMNTAAADADCGGASGATFVGENAVTIGDAVYTSTVTSVDSFTKQIEVVASVPNATNPVAEQRFRARATIDTENVSFNYALQAGDGGLVMENNAGVTGNVYSNGNITGANGASVTGDVWVAGGTQPTANQSSIIQNGDLIFGQDSTVVDPAQSFTPSVGGVLNSVKVYVKKVGSPSSKTVRILTDSGGSPTKTSLGSTTLDTSQVTGAFGWITVPFSTPPTLATGTTYWISVDASTNASNYLVWGKDTAQGYASGTAKTSPNWNAGSPVWTAANADLAFEAWMGGVATSMDNVDVGGEAHANTITNCSVTGAAYYQSNPSCSISGASYPGSADPGPAPFPISDAQIAGWKVDAAAGGTITGDYQPGLNSVVSLGPKEITGDLILSNNVTLTLTGTVYVHGHILLDNNSVIRLDPSYGSFSGVLLSDGWIKISNNGTFQNAGIGSFILVLSTATGGGDEGSAIKIVNNTEGAVFYSADGPLLVDNNVEATGFTGDSIYLKQNATLVYDTGLADARFTSGPGGSWVIQKGTWREIK